MEYFKPGESMRIMYDSVNDTGILGKRKSECSYQELVSLAAVFSIVTQRSSPQTAAHIRTTFLSTTLTNHHVVYIFRELGAPT